MRWLIYASKAEKLEGAFIGTVEAPDRYEAQRKAASGFWETHTPRHVRIEAPEQLESYWPIQLPAGGR